MEVNYLKFGGRLIPPDSDEGKELMKWNVKRPFAEFPKMLYMAHKRPDGIPSVSETDDGIFKGIAGAAERFTETCHKTVYNEAEMLKALELGWRKHPTEAMERFEAKARSIGDIAAQRLYEDRNMSEAAKAEAAKVDASTEEHVPVIPEAPRQKRKYTRRTAA